MSITVIFGSDGGATKGVASKISKKCQGRSVDIKDATTDDFENCHLLILGSPTYGDGTLQTDWRGVRGLFLMTLSRRELELTLGKLERQGIHHFVQELNQFKVNLFFGRPAYVAVARSIVTRPLNALTAEEDFMLGTLLGYDREQQCRRFLTRSGRGMPEDLPQAAE